MPIELIDLPFPAQQCQHTFGQNSKDMERTDINTNEDLNKAPQKQGGNHRLMVGLFFILGGAAWLITRMGYDIIPDWFFTWPMILIAIGLINGVKHSFQNPGAYIMLLIGGVFLVRKNFDVPYELQMYFWPILVIIAGVFIILRQPRHRKKKWRTNRVSNDDTTIFGANEGTIHDSSVIDSVVVFGGTQKDVISKSFEGGDIVCVFGGTEINFAKADFEHTAILDITVVFGGVKLILPPHWDLVIQTTNIAGGIDDKRRKDGPVSENPKTLKLTGSVIFGGLEVRSANHY